MHFEYMTPMESFWLCLYVGGIIAACLLCGGLAILPRETPCT